MDARSDSRSYTPYRPTNSTPAQREIRRDHYQTSFQTSHQRDVLPEQLQYRTLPAKQLTHGHHDREALYAAPELQHTLVEAPPDETHEEPPPSTREHTHHHIHEIVQPIVHKEVVQRHVIHTTVPIHELHHGPPRHHAMPALPPLSMAEFARHRDVLERQSGAATTFEGAPPSALGRFLDERWAASDGPIRPDRAPSISGSSEHRIEAPDPRHHVQDSNGRAQDFRVTSYHRSANESVAPPHQADGPNSQPAGVLESESQNRRILTHEMPAGQVGGQPPEAPEKKRRSLFRRLRRTLKEKGG